MYVFIQKRKRLLKKQWRINKSNFFFVTPKFNFLWQLKHWNMTYFPYDCCVVGGKVEMPHCLRCKSYCPNQINIIHTHIWYVCYSCWVRFYQWSRYLLIYCMVKCLIRPFQREGSLDQNSPSPQRPNIIIGAPKKK